MYYKQHICVLIRNIGCLFAFAHLPVYAVRRMLRHKTTDSKFEISNLMNTYTHSVAHIIFHSFHFIISFCFWCSSLFIYHAHKKKNTSQRICVFMFCGFASILALSFEIVLNILSKTVFVLAVEWA